MLEDDAVQENDAVQVDASEVNPDDRAAEAAVVAEVAAAEVVDAAATPAEAASGEAAADQKPAAPKKSKSKKKSKPRAAAVESNTAESNTAESSAAVSTAGEGAGQEADANAMAAEANADSSTAAPAGEADLEARASQPQPPKRRTRRAASRPAGSASELAAAFSAPQSEAVIEEPPAPPTAPAPALALFQPPPDVPALPKRPARLELADHEDETVEAPEDEVEAEAEDHEDTDETGAPKRRRRRGGRRRKKSVNGDAESGEDTENEAEEADAESPDGQDEEGEGGPSTRRRRRRRRAGGGSDSGGDDDPPNTVVHVRETRDANDQVSSVRGSTRLEAKKQRRREGREAGRRRPPILTEAEFLARRESVERVMVVRQNDQRTQIAVLEDNVLAEHYVSRSTSTSMVGNVYLGRVQNVLPSMEAAFVDIGRGRNAVLYAGEVNWDAAGLEGQPKRIELALKSGDAVMVQVTKDPVGHKGARLTSQISLPGRYLVFVPGGSMTGISRRLPDRERTRLKKLLRSVLPEDSGVIVRTAAEGATEEQIRHDVERLTHQWEELNKNAGSGKAPELLHGEPDIATRVVRDIFNEDFASLVVSGDQAGATIEKYVNSVAPDLADRVKRWTSNEDVFTAHRIDEQLAKALDRKVWLPSGGSLVIDHTEAMTVVDVNTGKFTGQGGNLEETVTRNNLEAAEEIVRQLRLRDVGGIIVVDFIDMVLESNRDLVLRRLLECLGRDRTKHQVAEVTSLGLVQMTRKRIGQGLLETFSEPCDCCNGRGVKVSTHPVDRGGNDEPVRRRRRPAGPIPGAPIAPKSAQAEPAAEAELEAEAELVEAELEVEVELEVDAELEAEADSEALEELAAETATDWDGDLVEGLGAEPLETEQLATEPEAAQATTDLVDQVAAEVADVDAETRDQPANPDL